MFVLIANVKSDKAFRIGAKVYIVSCTQSAHQAEATGLNRSGRTITKFIAWKRLTNIRTSAFIPPHIIRFCRLWWDSRDEINAVAKELTEIWQNVRYFRLDGTLTEGISAQDALRAYYARKGIENFTDVSPIPPIEARIAANRAAGHWSAWEALQQTPVQTLQQPA